MDARRKDSVARAAKHNARCPPDAADEDKEGGGLGCGKGCGEERKRENARRAARGNGLTGDPGKLKEAEGNRRGWRQNGERVKRERLYVCIYTKGT